MPPRTKTFIRQRTVDENDSGALKYLIHLKFVCVKKSIYLYSSIRVVFSHRSLDSSSGIKTLVDGPTHPKYAPLTALEKAELQLLSARSRTSSMDTGGGGSGGGEEEAEGEFDGNASIISL